MSESNFEFSREEVREQAADAVGGDQIVYRLTDKSDAFLFEHPLFRDPDVQAELDDLDDDDLEGIERVLLGGQWDRFIAEGGKVGEINRLMMVVSMKSASIARDHADGTRRPTRSSTSSARTRRPSKRR